MTESKKNKCIILGCGPSGGVPLITPDGAFWGDCDPQNPKNYRKRASVYVEYEGLRLLVDTSPDFRAQYLENNLRGLDAVLYTHAHSDHSHGIDNLRPLYFFKGREKVDVYFDQKTSDELFRSFGYLFHKGALEIYPQILEPHIIAPPSFEIGKSVIGCFNQRHGPGSSLGFRFGDLAYSTDFDDLDEAAIEALRGIKVWIIDCLSIEPRPTHLTLDQALAWIEKIKPEKAYLTHMSHQLDYEKLIKMLPPSILPAHDGMIIEL